MVHEPAILDTDTLSELSRGNPRVREWAQAYLESYGRLTVTAVTVFERLRGYRLALRQGKPYERQLLAFEALAARCLVLPFDEPAAGVAARIWSAAPQALRRQIGDILIAAISVSRQLPLVTRNSKDFERLAQQSGVDLQLLDWTGPAWRPRQRRPRLPG